MKLLSLLAGAALALTISTAQAGEPQRLSPAQLDVVTAGANLAASIGIGICEGGSDVCVTSAKQKASASESVRVGPKGGIKIKNKAKASSKARASSINGGAASIAVGVAATGVEDLL